MIQSLAKKRNHPHFLLKSLQQTITELIAIARKAKRNSPPNLDQRCNDDVNRVYAIVDDQSSASLITPDLADKLDAKGPELKYYFSTCGKEREVRYWRRVTGVIKKSVHGRTSRLHTLSECDWVSQDKEEILNLEIAMQYPHLRIIAEEIPPLASEARVQLLIGRDASKFLKVRVFKNGPKGSPWTQKLVLGWTTSGQACLNLIGGPIHVRARRTCVLHGRYCLAGTNTEAEFEVIEVSKLELRESFSEHNEVASAKMCTAQLAATMT